MAELVELRFERMLPELEQMKRIQLFEPEEIKEIVKERGRHMYRIQRLTKNLRDYLNFIKYEKGLLSLVRERRKSRHVPQKRANIDMAILNRIKILYKQAVHRFPEAVPVWDEYIQFCKVYKFKSDVPAIFDKMLQFHADKPEVWQKAVLWEHEEAKNKKRVLHVIMGGLQRHPKSEILYYTFFKLKLIEAQQQWENKDNEFEEKLITQAEIIYQDARKNINSIEFVVGMLEIVSQFSNAKSLEVTILSDMQTTYRDSELMWHTLGQRELNGRHLKDFDGENEKKSVPSSPEKCIELCVTIYETACELLDTEDMWSFYLETMFELNDVPDLPAELKEKCIKSAFDAALEKNKISEENFLKFVELAAENADLIEKDRLLDVLEKSTKKYPQSVALWELQMRYFIEYQQAEDVDRVFRQAVKSVPAKESFPLWELLLLFYKSDDKFSGKVKSVYKEAIDLALLELSNKLKPQFLEYLTNSSGITAARVEYNKLCLCVPSSLEMHQEMARLESIQGSPNVSAWRKCHEMATQFFGKDNVEVWLDFISFEKSKGDAKKISQLYLRAMNSLDKSLVGTFLEAYNLKANQIV